MIKVKDLKKVYKQVTVLDVVGLDIQRGECFGLVGNNGAGKTTLFRIMLDLVRATQGHVEIEGVDVTTDESWKRRVGAYLDEHMLLSYLTPTEYFETLRKMYGMSDNDLSLHLNKFEELFNGEILNAKKYIRDLSKGNQKKVGIVGALIGKPEIIILDEPFANLDPSTQIKLKKLIREWSQKEQVTFLISSHDLAHTTEVSNRIVLLNKGVVVKDIKTNPETLQELENFFAGTVHEERQSVTE